jgi:hypothetical protein
MYIKFPLFREVCNGLAMQSSQVLLAMQEAWE